MIKINKEGVYIGVVYRYRNNVLGDQQYGWSYIGNTLDESERRRKWNNPNTASYGGKKIIDARKKYGPDNFVYEVLAKVTGNDKNVLRKQLEAIEEENIVKFDSIQHGYNTSRGGTGNKGHKRTAAENAKMVATRRANGSYAHSEVTKNKLSIANTGRHHSPESIEKIRRGNTGKKRTDEQRKAQSERQKGRTMSKEARAKSSATKTGKPHPISAQGLASINAQRYKIPVIVTKDESGFYKEFPSMKSIESELGIKPGSVYNFLKTGNANKEGYRFAYKNGIKNIPKSKQNKNNGYRTAAA